MEKIHKDFHGALSVGFEFLAKKYGKETLDEYLKEAGRNIYKELIEKIKNEGLKALEKYWQNIFTLEKGDFKIEMKDDEEIILKVKKCPALEHMRKMNYSIYKDFCRQCKIINEVIAEETGLASEVISNQEKGSCIQKFWRKK